MSAVVLAEKCFSKAENAETFRTFGALVSKKMSEQGVERVTLAVKEDDESITILVLVAPSPDAQTFTSHDSFTPENVADTIERTAAAATRMSPGSDAGSGLAPPSTGIGPKTGRR